jgi:hypothetical protein
MDVGTWYGKCLFIFFIHAADQSCLSPEFFLGSARPVLRDEAMVTNTSIFIAWDVNVPLPSSCAEMVFSIPPFTYSLENRVSQSMVQPLFQMVSASSDHAI